MTDGVETSAATSGQRPTPRIDSVDVARGSVILGVVFNHAVDGLLRSGALAPEGLMANVNTALYIFRMPALVFLVGVFIPAGVRKVGAFGYATRRVGLLLYLLVVWQVVQGCVEILSADHRNGNTRAIDILTLWKPLAHLWFLPFLALGTVACVALETWNRPPWQRGLVLAGLVAVSLVTWGWDVRYFGSNASGLLLFLVAGSTVGLDNLAKLNRWAVTRVLAGAGMASAVFLALRAVVDLVPATQAADPTLGTRCWSILAAATGVLGVLMLSSLLARWALSTSVLAHLGRRTLAIYLGHVMVVAGCRVALSAMGVGAVETLLLAVPAAVLACLGLHSATQRGPFRWLLHLPGPWAHPASSPETGSRSRS